MADFEQAQIDVAGKSATVDVVHFDNPSGLPTLKATATFGGSTVELTHTLAPVDGAHAALDPAHVQNAIDDLRERAARFAILKDDIAQQLKAAK